MYIIIKRTSFAVFRSRESLVSCGNLQQLAHLYRRKLRSYSWQIYQNRNRFNCDDRSEVYKKSPFSFSRYLWHAGVVLFCYFLAKKHTSKNPS